MPDKVPIKLNNGRDETWFYREIWFRLLGVFPEGRTAKSIALGGDRNPDLDPQAREALVAERARIEGVAISIIDLFREVGVTPDRSPMVTDHTPAVHTPERNTVFFTETDFPHLLVATEPHAVDLHPLVRQFLDVTAKGWKVQVDRGDWGDGTAFVTITMPFKRQVALFLDRFGERQPKGFVLEDPTPVPPE